MAIIRDIVIKNFRAIRHLRWQPAVGLNCLIGHGDSGKSTILDAIDFTIGARRQITFTDADFHFLNTSDPIEIFITLGALDDELLNLDAYGHFFRGFNCATGEYENETSADLETVLTVKLSVRDDLEPDWRLYCEGVAAEGLERNLLWKHRQIVAPTRLGASSSYHLAWGQRSILNKLSMDNAQAASALAAAARQARQAFFDEGCKGVEDVLVTAKRIANEMGIPVNTLHALLDVKGVSFTGGAIALHDENHVPLKNLGSGSSRLLVAGLQQAAGVTSISIIDEIEYGLEPFRIVKLLDILGSKNQTPTNQVFLTTHSPIVLRELAAPQLKIVHNTIEQVPVEPDNLPASAADGIPLEPAQVRSRHKVLQLSGESSDQATLRACSDAFLARSVIVCEGKTEIGLIRGLDLYRMDLKKKSIISLGCHWADGGGDNMYQRALTFAKLGYRTALFKDSDNEPDAKVSVNLVAEGVSIFHWAAGQATEDTIFAMVPSECIIALLSLAVETKGEDSVDAKIQNVSGNTFNLASCQNAFVDEMRPVLGRAAKEKGWYKDVDPAERLMRFIIAPNWALCGPGFTTPLHHLWHWALGSPVQQTAESEE
jgi:putative ATP-dependent endonuclease of the OLD family